MSRTPDLWFNGETEFVGATGVDSVTEMADLILQGSEPDILNDLTQDGAPRTVEGLEVALRDAGVRCMAVPVPIMRQERWDGSQVYRLAENDRPGRGYVKVFGFNL